jgi:hypothetical protein
MTRTMAPEQSLPIPHLLSQIRMTMTILILNSTRIHPPHRYTSLDS